MFLSGTAVAENGATEPLVVRYPSLANPYGQVYNHNYYLEMLHLALASSGRDYRVETVPLPDFREGRREISLPPGVSDIHWLPTNRHRETRLRPIRIQFLKGMIGWRRLLIPEQARERFWAITHLDHLR